MTGRLRPSRPGAGLALWAVRRIGVCAGSLGVLVCSTTPAYAQAEGAARPKSAAVGCQVITQEQLEGYASASLALRGQVTGLTLLETSGQVGAGSNLELRGHNSLQGFTPLVFIDGIKISDTPDAPGQAISALDQINPSDILLIEIFRGPAATTLYGTDAASGIIRVYTIHGSTAVDVIDRVTAQCVP